MQLGLVMPKPEADPIRFPSLTRLIAVFAVVLAIAAVIFLVLPGLGH